MKGKPMLSDPKDPLLTGFFFEVIHSTYSLDIRPVSSFPRRCHVASTLCGLPHTYLNLSFQALSRAQTRRPVIMLLFTFLWALFVTRVFASFGYTDGGTYWTIDNGKNLVIEVSKTNGDIQSMKYNVSIIQQGLFFSPMVSVGAMFID